MPGDAAPSFVWIPDLGAPGAVLRLPAEPSHYLKRVCRVRPGELISLTDGDGGLAKGRIASVGQRVEVEVESVDRATRRRQSTVICGAPEGQRADWLIEKLSELGVAVLQPVDLERARWERSSSRTARWLRLALAALGQSRRRYLLEIREPMDLETVLGMLPSGGPRWLADPGGRPIWEIPPPAEPESVGFVGPSPGLSGEEGRLVGRAGFLPICLSDSRLRTETAAMLWAGWVGGWYLRKGVFPEVRPEPPDAPLA